MLLNNIDAATIPLVACTAALSMLWQSIPMPWSPRPSSEPLPFIIYGGSSALGCFAAKLAKASNVHPIIAICRGNDEYISRILDSSKGDAVIDNREGPEATKAAVKKALGPLEAHHALDAISANGTWVRLSQMLASGGQVSVVSGANAYDEAQINPEVTIKYTYVGAVHSGAYMPAMPKQPADAETVKIVPEFAYVLFRYLARMLAQGTFEGHPYELIPGGLEGVEIGLQKLKNGEAKGRKFVYRISDTGSLLE
jgi:NADPH2:quinone reductase